MKTMTGRAIAGFAVLVMLGALFMAGAPARAADDPGQKALAWLALVDGGQYGASWEQASSFFKAAVSRQKWVQSLDGVRKPLGKLVSRQEASRKEATQLPGAPDGQYLVLTYKTSMAHKAAATETLTMMKDKDGSWRAAGYYIK